MRGRYLCTVVGIVLAVLAATPLNAASAYAAPALSNDN